MSFRIVNTVLQQDWLLFLFQTNALEPRAGTRCVKFIESAQIRVGSRGRKCRTATRDWTLDREIVHFGASDNKKPTVPLPIQI